MQKFKVLWADDEIDLLKPHILFLEGKGYEVISVFSGLDAVDVFKKERVDVVFLDENMPGISGLEALQQIKAINPQIPVVMITKNEEEHIMEEAIGSKIADYLIKPLNPNQILLALKKVLQGKELVSEKSTTTYRQEFRQIMMALDEAPNALEWTSLYRKLVFHDIEIQASGDKAMQEVIETQKKEAGTNFCRFMQQHYEALLNATPSEKSPVFSHQVLRRYLSPLLEEKKKVLLLVMDNMRLDQWMFLQPLLHPYFYTETDTCTFSILPATTEFARNALFSGLLPLEMQKKFPHYWTEEVDEGSRNRFESEWLGEWIRRHAAGTGYTYHKVTQHHHGKELAEMGSSLFKHPLTAVVINFIDMLSHSRTEMNMVRELTPDEQAYRGLTRTWFEHSSILEILQTASAAGITVLMTTDHGTVRVQKPFKIVGERETTSNLRYKSGRNLGFEEGKEVWVVAKPDRIGLPKKNMSDAYVFATEDYFFVYPNNYNQFVQLYRDTFQHGGISPEEMIIPLAVLRPK